MMQSHEMVLPILRSISRGESNGSNVGIGFSFTEKEDGLFNSFDLTRKLDTGSEQVVRITSFIRSNVDDADSEHGNGPILRAISRCTTGPPQLKSFPSLHPVASLEQVFDFSSGEHKTSDSLKLAADHGQGADKPLSTKKEQTKSVENPSAVAGDTDYLPPLLSEHGRTLSSSSFSSSFSFSTSPPQSTYTTPYQSPSLSPANLSRESSCFALKKPDDQTSVGEGRIFFSTDSNLAKTTARKGNMTVEKKTKNKDNVCKKKTCAEISVRRRSSRPRRTRKPVRRMQVESSSNCSSSSSSHNSSPIGSADERQEQGEEQRDMSTAMGPDDQHSGGASDAESVPLGDMRKRKRGRKQGRKLQKVNTLAGKRERNKLSAAKYRKRRKSYINNLESNYNVLEEKYQKLLQKNKELQQKITEMETHQSVQKHYISGGESMVTKTNTPGSKGSAFVKMFAMLGILFSAPAALSHPGSVFSTLFPGTSALQVDFFEHPHSTTGSTEYRSLPEIPMNQQYANLNAQSIPLEIDFDKHDF